MAAKKAELKFGGEIFTFYTYANTKRDLAKIIKKLKQYRPEARFRVVKRNAISQHYKAAKLVMTRKSHHYDLYVR